ncbi:MAG: hypothetical protein RIR11_437 [Bacteroidota bacterium]
MAKLGVVSIKKWNYYRISILIYKIRNSKNKQLPFQTLLISFSTRKNMPQWPNLQLFLHQKYL